MKTTSAISGGEAAFDKRGRPIGNGTVGDIGLDQPLWSPTVMNRRQGGLHSAEWIR